MSDEERYRCPGCRHPWKQHDRYGCTYSTLDPEGGFFADCNCERTPPAGHRD